MSRRRRLIRSKRLFELDIRVKEGLPFPALCVIALILKSALARTQRDNKVILCDFLWMGNHVHILLMSLCPEACVNFYQELQKKICDSFKRLLGVHKLNMWEGDPVLAEVEDLGGAIKRKAYLYANPAKAHLVETVSDYPGLSTWREFSTCPPRLDASFSEQVPWIRLPFIGQLPGRSLSERQDKFICTKLLEAVKSRRPYTLEVCPNAWMKVFKIETEEEIASVNRRIRERIEKLEEDYRAERRTLGKRIIGKLQLARQPIFKPHTPKKRERRVFVFAASKEIRLAYIRMHNEICSICAECYQRWKSGDFSVQWPPGTFPPSPSVRASALVLG